MSKKSGTPVTFHGVSFGKILTKIFNFPIFQCLHLYWLLLLPKQMHQLLENMLRYIIFYKLNKIIFGKIDNT